MRIFSFSLGMTMILSFPVFGVDEGQSQPSFFDDAPSVHGVRSECPAIDTPPLEIESFQLEKPAAVLEVLPHAGNEERLKTSCDGSSCGCFDAYLQCMDACGGVAGTPECKAACRQAELTCSICCCAPETPRCRH